MTVARVRSLISPAQLGKSLRTEEAEAVTGRWEGRWLGRPQTLTIRGTLELSSGATAGRECGFPLNFLGELQAVVVTC